MIAIIDIIKSNVEFCINRLIIMQITIAIKAINRYVPIFVRSSFVVAPNTAKSANTTDVIKNTNKTDVISYAINILENVKPLTKAYNKNDNFAVSGLILVILADKKITKPISMIARINNPQPPKLDAIFMTALGFNDKT